MSTRNLESLFSLSPRKPRVIHLLRSDGQGNTACSVVRPLKSGFGSLTPGPVTCRRCQQVIARLDREAVKTQRTP